MTNGLGRVVFAVVIAALIPAVSSAIEIHRTNGEVIRAISAESVPFDMVRITMPDSTYDYLAPVKISAVIDASGVDRTKALIRDRETIGTPLPPALRVPGPGPHVGPRSVTQAFVITETTLLTRVDSGPDMQRHRLGGRLDFDFGMMVNVGENTALGATAFVGAGNEYANAGIRLRARRWLSRTASADIAPGIIALEHRWDGSALPPGFSLQVSLNPSRYVSVTTEVFTIRHYGYSSRERTEARDTSVLLGGRIGQWPGAVAGAVALFAALAMSSIQVMY
jgi:hypothetical protein